MSLRMRYSSSVEHGMYCPITKQIRKLADTVQVSESNLSTLKLLDGS
jgi:hypothetical protein